MASVNGNVLLIGVHGMFGKSHYYRKLRGKTFVSAAPRKVKTVAAARQKTIDRFTLATHYARTQMNDPEIKELYRSRVNARKITAYLVAVSDFMMPPEVEEITTFDYHGHPGDVITVDAWDDFEVDRIAVSIYFLDGTLLEEGDATPKANNPALWDYKAQFECKEKTGLIIEATAWDRPGNKHTLSTILNTF